ncbi:MAG: nucleotidyltransferase family protein, partial [Oscillospiraceae bacterium]|nr:nucleotidyltransferase family protein [Oscillospiraceae bacterium]
MHTCAIIAEYNPFHNGHAWQIAEARHRGAKRIVAVMSGNFVQRGTPAVLPKEIRVAAALSCGADLVVELPLPYATASAEQFAAAGVHLAASLGVVDTLVFGAETPNVSKLIGLTRTLL